MTSTLTGNTAPGRTFRGQHVPQVEVVIDGVREWREATTFDLAELAAMDEAAARVAA